MFSSCKVFPTRAPIKIAIPPTTNILRALFEIPVFVTLPLMTPRTNKNTNDKRIDIQRAYLIGSIIYGTRGMRPEIRYEKNIMMELTTGFRLFEEPR